MRYLILANLLLGSFAVRAQTTNHAISLEAPPVEIPAGFVATPNGHFHPSCVIEVQEDETVDGDGSIIGKDGLARPTMPCAHDHYDARGRRRHRDAPTVSGWVVDADSTSPGNVSWISADWTVPAAPSNVQSQTVYFFPGFEDSGDSTFILQPVLGWNQYGIGAGWSIAGWNCCKNGNAYRTSFMSVSAGDSIYGYVWGTSCNSTTGVCTSWQVYVSNGTTSATLNTNSFGDPMNWTFGGVLEAYSISSCNEYPPSQSLAFTSITVKDINGSNVTPTWSTSTFGASPACSASASTTSSTATLSWCIPYTWQNDPGCDGHCGQNVSDGCGGTVSCPAQHSCPSGEVWDDTVCYCTT